MLKRYFVAFFIAFFTCAVAYGGAKLDALVEKAKTENVGVKSVKKADEKRSQAEILDAIAKEIEEINALKQQVTAQQKALDAVKSDTVSQATPVETQSWWQRLLILIISLTGAVAVPIISLLIIILLKKWGLNIEQNKIEWILTKIVGYAEQKAKVALKDGKPLTGPETLKIALDQGDKLLKEYSLDKKFSKWLTDLIEAKLGEKERKDVAK